MVITAFFYLQTFFTIWMLVDAIRSQAEYYWYFIIFFFQPVGAWVYFFAVKFQGFGWLKRFVFERPPSLKELRYNLSLNPSVSNKIQVAEALYRQKQYQESASIFSDALSSDSEEKSALRGLGLCKVKLGDLDGGIACLQKLVAIDEAFADHAPTMELADALWQNGKKNDALSLVENLAQRRPRFNNQFVLASYLSQIGQKEKAREILLDLLEDFKHTPRFARRNGVRWVREAKRLLESLS